MVSLVAASRIVGPLYIVVSPHCCGAKWQELTACASVSQQNATTMWSLSRCIQRQGHGTSLSQHKKEGRKEERKKERKKEEENMKSEIKYVISSFYAQEVSL